MSSSCLMCIFLCIVSHFAVNCLTTKEFTTNSNELVGRHPFKWLNGVQNMIESPTGHVVAQVAKELLNRSAGNSQVLSLNLTNLFIILLLKVLIFLAGILGTGNWSNYGYARSQDEVFPLSINHAEAYLITGFLAAQGGYDECLYSAACESPNIAYEYARAAKVIADVISKYEGINVTNGRYNKLIVLLEEAAQNGYRGAPCNTTTICDNLF